MSTKLADSPTKGGRLRHAGPENVLQYMISDSPHADAKVGVIIWGFGIAEVKTARRLVRQGFPCMQIRFTKSHTDTTPQKRNRHNFGVEACRLAIDTFAAERGLNEFVLMGNCAIANICFSATMATPSDPRIVGLILTNPHLRADSTAGNIFARKITSRSTWSRLFRGEINLRGAVKFVGFTVRSMLSRAPNKGARRKSAAPAGTKRDTLIEPARFRDALHELSARQVKLLVAGGTGDSIMRRFEIVCGPAMKELSDQGNLTFEHLETDFHIFSKDDNASTLLADSVTRWMASTQFRVPGHSGFGGSSPLSSA